MPSLYITTSVITPASGGSSKDRQPVFTGTASDIGSGIDISFHKYQSEPTKGPIVLAFVGRFLEDKGFFYLRTKPNFGDLSTKHSKISQSNLNLIISDISHQRVESKDDTGN